MWRVVFILAVIATTVVADPPCDDPNAATPPGGCSWNCNQHCSNYIEGRTDYCARIACPPDECGCKDGYYLDGNTNMCVPGYECSYPQPNE